MTVLTDDDVLQKVGADVKSLAREPEKWKNGIMSNGKSCLIAAETFSF